MGKKPVYAGNSDIVKAYDFVTECFSCDRCLFGYRDVAGASRRDDDRTYTVRLRLIPYNGYACLFAVADPDACSVTSIGVCPLSTITSTMPMICSAVLVSP